MKNLSGLAALALLVVSGCGTMLNSRMKIYTLEPGVIVDGESGTVTLDQQVSHDVEYTGGGGTCELESHTSPAYVILDVLGTGLVGLLVDAATDDWKVLSECRGVVLK